MAKNREENIHVQIIERAKQFGACLAGIASVEALKSSPSHLIYGKLDEFMGVGFRGIGAVGHGEVTWPEDARSVIVIAVQHPEEKPELDWWKSSCRGGTEGNAILIGINAKLSEWLEKEYGIRTHKLAYHIGGGGIFLKDSAVMAGLGCIGKSNLFVAPEFGPRVRLRAMLTDEALPATGPIDFDPCEDCSMPCREACPQEAFRSEVYSEEDFGLDKLPARTGVYSRHACNVQMGLDVSNSKETSVERQDEPAMVIRFCRLCEFACPIGKTD